MHARVNASMKSLTKNDLTVIANRGRALGDPTRLRILTVLARGEQPVGQIAEAIETEQSTVSRHLQVLFHAGLVQRRREASAVIYSIAADDMLEWLDYLARPDLGTGRRATRRAQLV